MEGRGRVRWQQGTCRLGRAPGPDLDLLAPVDRLGLLAHAFLSVLAASQPAPATIAKTA